MKRNEFWAIFIPVLYTLLMLAIAVSIIVENAKSEGYSQEDNPNQCLMYAICQPDDYICIRSKANRKSHEEGYLLCGFSVYVSDQTKNGFVYSSELNTESGEGWIFTGYLVNDEPLDMDGKIYKVVSNARVAARKYINGPRRGWLKNGDLVEVHYMTEEWCVTNKGFVMTKYLEEYTEE